jgi:predicted pyridoxine 5'-phosphate oxidase superfamily flavin-nucleotide-binding protein
MTTWPHAVSPFHPGERAIQQLLGVRERVEDGGRRLIRDFLPDEHRDFYARLPFLVLGTLNAGGSPAASIVSGKPGFVSSPHPKALTISIDFRSTMPTITGLVSGADVGILGIDLSTRRRNRLNGIVSAIRDDAIEIEIVQAYGNCPKYITVREWATSRHSPTPLVSESNALGNIEQAIVAAADTFFIASAFGRTRDNPCRGVDASHRGDAARIRPHRRRAHADRARFRRQLRLQYAGQSAARAALRLAVPRFWQRDYPRDRRRGRNCLGGPGGRRDRRCATAAAVSPEPCPALRRRGSAPLDFRGAACS